MKNIRFIALIIGLSFILAAGMGCSTQKAATQPEAAAEADWRYPDIVDVDFVSQYVKVPLPEGVMIIDARPKKAKYDKGHIPMAVIIPDSYFDKMTDKLPADKETLLIFYCGGLKCKLSHKSAFKAEKLGYKNVKVFAEGFPKWMAVEGHYAAVSTDWVKKTGGHQG
jgi:rhodanese-related sulfurtransferase